MDGWLLKYSVILCALVPLPEAKIAMFFMFLKSIIFSPSSLPVKLAR
jgi:hypothetical protein